MTRDSLSSFAGDTPGPPYYVWGRGECWDGKTWHVMDGLRFVSKRDLLHDEAVALCERLNREAKTKTVTPTDV